MSETTNEHDPVDPSGAPADAGTGPDENQLDPGRTSPEDAEDGGRADAG